MEVVARGLVVPVIGMRLPFTEIETIFDAVKREAALGQELHDIL